MANNELVFTDDSMDGSMDDLSDRDLNRLRNLHSKAGYRDGISDGQESMLQAGFNNGFSKAAEKYRQSSKLRGCISALMIFFNGNKVGFEKLLKDLEDLLNELKEVEGEKPEVDEIMTDYVFKSEIDNTTKDKKMENFDPHDIEMLVGSFSIKENNDSTSVDQSAKHLDGSSCTDSFDKMNNAKDNVSSCKHQESNYQKIQQCQGRGHKRLSLKNSFDFEDKVEQMEQLLRSHNVSDSFLAKLRKNVLTFN